MGDREATSREREMATLRDAAKHIGVDKLKDGSWFRRIVQHHVRKHEETIAPAHWDALYPGKDAEQRAHAQIVGVARRAAAAGALASVGSSTGELLSLVTEGLGAPIGVPAAMTSMALEAAYTALLQIDLACDLASIYGVPFDAEDVGEIATLFGLALEIEVERTGKRDEESDAPEKEDGLTSRLMSLEDGEMATRIGRKLLEESLMRNIVPIVGVAISARWNYVATMKLGGAVKRYARYRRALAHACKKLSFETITSPSVVIEGAWLLATVDGDAKHDEVMAMALLVDALPEAQRKSIALDETLGDDEEAWFEELAKTPKEMHEPLLDALYMIAATDKELETGERRFLRRVGKALGRPIDFERIEHVCRHLARGDDLPDDFWHPQGIATARA